MTKVSHQFSYRTQVIQHPPIIIFALSKRINKMTNSPELSGKYLGTISSDFIKVADSLKEASYQIRKAGFEFPVFAICKAEQPVGKLLLDRKDLRLDWNYYASFLNEFVQRELVMPDREEDFKRTYKDPEEFCCLFVVDKEFTNFVYIPYPED